MKPVRSRSVYRYLLPSDSFVRILLCDASAQELCAKPGLNRAGYRRLVIEACCPEFREDLAHHLMQLAPHDPLAAEDLLYQLCIEVNPQLDIHTVRLRDAQEIDEEIETGLGTSTEPRRGEDALDNLRKRTRGLRQRLARRIVGQDEAVERVTNALGKAAAGLAEERRPLATFLLVGRTGTGKTELARSLAREVFGRGDQPGLVRVDCSEFALAHEYSKLIGAPPGYVGHEHGGFLTDAVRKTPDCVVLFDEIEKAHPRMHNLLLQVLDEGQLTDSRGKRTDFSRAAVVLTSNVGARDIVAASKQMGFGRGLDETGTLGAETLHEITWNALEQSFSPEFLGRIDECILFRELEDTHAREIAKILLTDLSQRARRRGLKVACSHAVAKWVAERGFHPDSGARELRRVIAREIENPLAELVLQKRPRSRELVRVSIRRGRPAFDIER